MEVEVDGTLEDSSRSVGAVEGFSTVGTRIFEGADVTKLSNVGAPEAGALLVPPLSLVGGPEEWLSCVNPRGEEVGATFESVGEAGIAEGAIVSKSGLFKPIP